MRIVSSGNNYDYWSQWKNPFQVELQEASIQCPFCDEQISISDSYGFGSTKGKLDLPDPYTDRLRPHVMVNHTEDLSRFDGMFSKEDRKDYQEWDLFGDILEELNNPTGECKVCDETFPLNELDDHAETHFNKDILSTLESWRGPSKPPEIRKVNPKG